MINYLSSVLTILIPANITNLSTDVDQILCWDVSVSFHAPISSTVGPREASLITKHSVTFVRRARGFASWLLLSANFMTKIILLYGCYYLLYAIFHDPWSLQVISSVEDLSKWNVWSMKSKGPTEEAYLIYTLHIHDIYDGHPLAK